MAGAVTVPASIEVMNMKVTLDISEDNIKELINNYIGDDHSCEISEELIARAINDELHNMQLLRNYNYKNHFYLFTILHEAAHEKN